MMKKILIPLVLIIAILISFEAQAQKPKTVKKEEKSSSFHYGVKLGFNNASLSGDNDQDYRFGLNAGFFMVNDISSHFSVQTDLLYSQRGNINHSGDDDITTQLDYIEVPVLLKYKFKLQKGIYGRIFAGPVFGFLASANQLTESEWFDDTNEELDNIKSFDAAVAVGANVKTYISGVGKFLFDFRFHFGLGNIFDTGSLERSHSFASLTAGYFLN